MALDVMVDAELFTTDYNDLTMNQRANAVEQAKALGREAMQDDLAGDGVTIRDYESPNDARIRDTYLSVVESFTDLSRRDISDIVTDDDPRVDAFVRGFRAEETDQLSHYPDEAM